MARSMSHPYFVPRAGRTRIHVGRATAAGAVLYLLALAGSGIVAATRRAQHRLDAWAEARRHHAEDEQLRRLAQSDPRLMAELVALEQRAEREA